MKFLKPIVSIVLIAAIVVQVLGKFIVLAHYALNKEAITKTLCVNKNKPKMHCNGKCHLKKQLSKEDKKEQSPANPFKEVKDFQLYSANNSGIEITNTLINHTEKSIFQYSFHFSSQHLQAVFHPPCV